MYLWRHIHIHVCGDQWHIIRYLPQLLFLLRQGLYYVAMAVLSWILQCRPG